MGTTGLPVNSYSFRMINNAYFEVISPLILLQHNLRDRVVIKGKKQRKSIILQQPRFVISKAKMPLALNLSKRSVLTKDNLTKTEELICCREFLHTKNP